MKVGSRLFAASSAIALAAIHAPAWAQQSLDAQGSAEVREIIVTGVARSASRLDSSLSISTLDAVRITDIAPRSTAELLRVLPGFRVEASAGGGNSNMQVRGLPAVTGGAQFISLQEDGLPVLLFGDHQFAPADGFVKIDATLARVEAVRGGSATTLATNGNGAIINLIHRTGQQPGGSLAILKGADYRDTRVDAEYGGEVTGGWFLHAGGHYQIGGDSRGAGYDAIRGGKLRVSATREFPGGYLRIYGQMIDKKDATFLPQAVRLTEVAGSVAAVAQGAAHYGQYLGTVAGGVAGLDPRRQTLHSRYLIGLPVVDGEGRLRSTDLRNGIRTRARQVGGELQFEPAAGLTISNRFRYSALSGNFMAPFTHATGDADSYLAATFGAGAEARFLNGPAAGQSVTSASLLALTGNPLISEVALFDTELNDMGNIANDFRVSRKIDTGAGPVTVTGGYFRMVQEFRQTWHWGRYLVSTQDAAAVIDVPGYTEQGVFTYNGAFGACCNDRFDARAGVHAFYGDLDARLGALSLSASVRAERMAYRGYAARSSRRDQDINGDGTIGPAERGVPLADPAKRVDATGSLRGTSYSLGASYRLTPGLAAFTRFSRGVTWNFDRQFGAFGAGGIVAPDLLRNTTRQIEAGLKWRDGGNLVPGALVLDLTVFSGRANLRNYSITTDQASGGIYVADGLELEVSYDRAGASLFGNGTYTRAKAQRDFTDPARSGLRPMRQADLVYTFGGSIKPARHMSLGCAVSGTSGSFADFENRIRLPAYATLSAFASLAATERLTFSLNASNLLNAIGFTEADGSRLFDTDGNGAYDTTVGRSIAGRTVAATARYTL